MIKRTSRSMSRSSVNFTFLFPQRAYAFLITIRIFPASETMRNNFSF